MNRFLPFAAAILLSGCALDEETFATEYAEQYCAYHDECGTISFVGGDYDACVALQESAQLTVLESDACEYDAGSAKACIDEMKDLTCPEDEAESSGVDAAASCAAVCGG